MARYDDINTPAVVVVGFVSAILVFAIIVGAQAIYFNYENSLIESRNANRPAAEASNLIAEQEALLQRKGWLNRADGKIAIPIEQAMKVVVEDLRKSQTREVEQDG